MNGIITFLLGFVLFILIVLAIVFHKSVKNFKNIIQQAADAREARKIAEEEAYFKRTSTKHYREDNKPKFKEDYFKGTGESHNADPRQRPRPNQQQRPNPNQSSQQENTTRRTVETDGVTIIDDRSNKPADRKIFNDGEGEYVDFEEVTN